jgi:hypothetical protein
MDISRRLLGPIALPLTADADPRSVEIDIDGFVRRVLLFDTFILYSVRLKEIPLLVTHFGDEGIRELISAGALKFRCECTQFVEGQFKTPACPAFTYQFHVVDAHDHEQYVHDCLANVHESPGLKHKQIVKLKNAIVDAIARPDARQMFTTDIAPSFESDLLRNPRITVAAARIDLKRTHQVDVPDFAFQACKVGDDRYEVHTDLAERANISDKDAHEIVKRALLAVAELNQRIAEMRSYSALSGFAEDDVDLFRTKLGFLAPLATSENQEGRFQRVISIADLPQVRIEPDTRIRVDRLLEVRASSELHEFRDWLLTIDSASDTEIRERVASLRVRLGAFAQSGPGKILRFFVTQGASMMPGPVGLGAGLALGAVDQFLVDKVLGRSGIAAFVNELYPSLFKGK